jgi:hypothetical protein
LRRVTWYHRGSVPSKAAARGKRHGATRRRVPAIAIHPVTLGATLVVAIASSLVLTPGYAQSYTNDAPFAALPAPTGASPEDAGPAVSIRLVREISLPGPLPGDGPVLIDGEIRIPVDGGVAFASPTVDQPPRIAADSSAGLPLDVADDGWAVAPDDRRRFRANPGGFIEAQKRCRRCKAGWKKKWRLRVPGGVPSAPVVVGDRVLFGALDNRVYCVKARNGHRVWARDVDRRVSGSLVPWTESRYDDTEPLALVLVVPDGGQKLVALEVQRGNQVAGIDLGPGDGRIVSVPVALPDGNLVVARQRYARTDAALLIYRLEADRGDAADEAAPAKDAATADVATADTVSGAP